MKNIKTAERLICVEGCDNLNVELKSEHLDTRIEIIKFKISSEEPIQMHNITISWKQPIIDIHSFWYPTAFRNKTFNADWARGFSSKATISAPVACLYNLNGQNRLTFALKDALNTVYINAGVHEEDATFICKIELFNEPSKKISTYCGEIRIDSRDIPYYESLKDVSKWWESFIEYKPSYVPDHAREPMYSTWYSFHQELTNAEIEKECAAAKKIGCEAVIVDDGWQTDDNNRGYAYCGDWKVSKNKILDMKEHVKKIHEIGLKYIIWYSVPFVGIYSDAWNEFKDCLLSFNQSLKAGVLDPRYPKVREYLISTYENAVKTWNLDGLKLDFVDDFDLPKDMLDKYNESMDFESVQEAVDALLSTIIEDLRSINPDIMIEFRQRYIGPYMRKYGNMFRVVDCANDSITNRIGTMDIRLLCGKTAAHSDMLMWNTEDTVESASLQFINVLFAVPQFSMKFENLKKDHFKMAKFWLFFWKQHRNTLLDGQLKPYYPELNYPLITSSSDREEIAVVYSDIVIPVYKHNFDKLVLVNGTLKNKIYIDIEEYDFGEREIEVFNCCGEFIRKDKINLNKGVHSIDVPAAGIVYLTIKISY